MEPGGLLDREPVIAAVGPESFAAAMAEQGARVTRVGWEPPPLDAHLERLWRDDRIYDLIVILGYNDDPVVPGAGSAIFLHLARPDYAPTHGCVATARADLETLLVRARPGDALEIRKSPLHAR